MDTKYSSNKIDIFNRPLEFLAQIYFISRVYLPNWPSVCFPTTDLDLFILLTCRAAQNLTSQLSS